MARTSLMMALVVLLVGCSRWVPARIGTVPVGAEVRLRLSNEGAERLEESTGTPRVEVSGELVRRAEEVMVAARVPAVDGTVDRGLRQRVIVHVDDIVAVEVRERARNRSRVLGGGAVVFGGGALVLIAKGLFGGGTPPNTLPPPPEVGEPAVLRAFDLILLRIFR